MGETYNATLVVWGWYDRLTVTPRLERIRTLKGDISVLEGQRVNISDPEQIDWSCPAHWNYTRDLDQPRRKVVIGYNSKSLRLRGLALHSGLRFEVAIVARRCCYTPMLGSVSGEVLFTLKISRQDFFALQGQFESKDTPIGIAHLHEKAVDRINNLLAIIGERRV